MTFLARLWAMLRPKAGLAVGNLTLRHGPDLGGLHHDYRRAA